MTLTDIDARLARIEQQKRDAAARAGAQTTQFIKTQWDFGAKGGTKDAARHALDALALAEARRLLAGQQWQPIATAPKDERYILGWCRQWKTDVIAVRWLPGSERYSTCYQPTHWMPLPAPPPEDPHA